MSYAGTIVANHEAKTETHGVAGAVVGTTSTQTLTNKTLTAPAISAPVVTGNGTITVATKIVDTSDATKQLAFAVSGITTGTTRTITVQDSDMTLVGRATTETLTNKTLTAPTITTPVISGAVAAGPFVHVRERTFTQTSGNGTYTATVVLPAGATLLDILVTNVALWDDTSASLEVGDGGDPDGFYTAVDLKATDLLAGETLSFALAGGVEGAYIANSHVTPRYYAAGGTITATVTQVGTGTLGRTRVQVLYIAPAAGDITAATKA